MVFSYYMLQNTKHRNFNKRINENNGGEHA